MKPATTLLILAAVVLALTGSFTAPAHALLTRTWVSGVGNDANPCTRTAPCASFATAISNTAAGGQIDCIDAGSFSAVTITKSIIISCEAGTAGVLAAGSSGITVNVASTDIVTLRGLDIEGPPPGSGFGGSAGIEFNNAGTLRVEKCLIRALNADSFGFGILFRPNGPASLFVADTVVSDNGAAGNGGNILLAATASASANVSLERVQMTGGSFGLTVDGTFTTGTVQVSVVDSLAAGAQFNGFDARGRAKLLINRSTSSNNSDVGVRANGSNVQLYIGNSVVSGNGTGVFGVNGASLLSYQNNLIDQNTSNGTPLSPVAVH